MALIVATLLLFASGPFVLWPLIKTPPEEAEATTTHRTEEGMQ
jgi:hypothetical protein